jgi:hypothetical protein
MRAAPESRSGNGLATGTPDLQSRGIDLNSAGFLNPIATNMRVKIGGAIAQRGELLRESINFSGF